MTREEKNKLLDFIGKEHDFYTKHMNDEIEILHGKIEGANYILNRLLEHLKNDSEMKTNTHIVIKREDVFKYLTDSQIEDLDIVLNTIADGREKDGKKTDNSYYICNTDEPYADEVLEVILKAESEASNDKI